MGNIGDLHGYRPPSEGGDAAPESGVPAPLPGARPPLSPTPHPSVIQAIRRLRSPSAGPALPLAAGVVALGLAACGGGDREQSASEGGPATARSGTARSASVLTLPRRPPLVVAHRGASAYHPEHTFPAWDAALAMGADYLEQDLQLTADSVLVVLHDETLDRTSAPHDSTCFGRVRDVDAERATACPAGPDPSHRIPTLDSVLTRYAGRARFYIETKAPEAAPGMEEALVDLLNRHGLLPVGTDREVIVQSFSPGSLRRVRTLAPSIPLVQLLSSGEAAAGIWRRLPEIADYAVGIGPSRSDVTPQLVEAAHRLCLEVHPYTVNEEEEMGRLLDWGVDGFFTDRPDVGRRIASAAGTPQGPATIACPI